MILLRHGESEFNVVYRETGQDPGIRDPRLTERGHQQAGEAVAKLASNGVRRALVSPFTRTLQTAEAFALPTVIEAVIREHRAFACDLGTPTSELTAAWPHYDFSHLDENWWSLEAESEAQVRVRAEQFRAMVLNWPDHHEVVVVSHWGFILALTGLSVKNCEMIDYDPHRQP